MQSVTRAFGQVKCTRTVRNAVAMTKKYMNFESFWGCKSRMPSSGVMPQEEKKNESEKETNPPLIFRTTHIFKNRSDFFLYSLKKSNRRSLTLTNKRFQLYKSQKMKGNHVRYFVPT